MRRSHLARYDKVSIFVKQDNKQDYGKIIWLEENKVILDNGRKYNYNNIIDFKRKNI